MKDQIVPTTAVAAGLAQRPQTELDALRRAYANLAKAD
jgi:hypothetical protein